MKNLCFFSVLIVVAHYADAQTIVKETKFYLHDSNNHSVAFADMVLDKQKRELGLFYLDFGAGTTPVLREVSLGVDEMEKEENAISDKSKISERLFELRNAVPGFMEAPQPDGEPAVQITGGFGGPFIAVKDKGNAKVSRPPFEGKPFAYPQNLVDEKHERIFFVYGENVKGERFSAYKNLHLIMYSYSGDIQNSIPLNFEYARDVKLATGVSSPNVSTADQKGFEKAVFVFGRYPGLSGKYNHPDKTVYDMILVDAEGNKTYQHTFNAGTESETFYPEYAYELNDNLVVFGKLGGKQASYVQLVFDASGLKETKHYKGSELYTAEDPQKFTAIRREGETRVPELSLTISQLFKVAGHAVGKDGSVSLVGHAVVEEKENIPADASRGIPEKTIIRHFPHSFNILNFDGGLNITKQFAIPTKSFAKVKFIESGGSHFAAVSPADDGKANFNIRSAVVVDPKNSRSADNSPKIEYLSAAKTESSPVVIQLEGSLPYVDFRSNELYNINNDSKVFGLGSGEVIVAGVYQKKSNVRTPVEIKVFRIKF